LTRQERAPFAEALARYAETDARMFSTPGHKRGMGAPEPLKGLLADAFRQDIPHAGGVDTTHISLGLLREAEGLAAEAYGGDEARFLVNGSTTGNLAMLLATCRDGDEAIISRMLHKSLLAGLVFSGARPVYVVPEMNAARDLPLDVAPETVEAALREHPSAKAVVLVSPSYVGVTSDLRAIAALCHARGVPLLVDEAWGPHFHFHPELPDSAMQAGADVGVSSTHKMLSALTQGSTLVARQGLIDLERLHTIVDMVQTTSPSALIFASLDAARQQMAMGGERLLGQALGYARRLRTGLAAMDGVSVLDERVISERPGARLDPTRVLVDVHGLGFTGYEAEMLLRERHGIYVEMSDLLSVMLLVTIGDDATSIDRALAGFGDLVARRRPMRNTIVARSSGALLFGGTPVMTPREAFMTASVVVPVGDSIGRISSESITPYPPGIPIVAPGERLSVEIMDYLRAGASEGMYISGLSDASFATVRVVKKDG